MDKKELKNKIIDVIETGKLGSVATIKEDQPWVRYMVIHRGEDLDCYTASFAKARKVEQIKKDPRIHITLGGDPHNYDKPYINMQAKAQVKTDLETKKKCWSDALKQFFSGPEDPDYVAITITPQLIEYMEPHSIKPEVYKVD